ncbi:MAG: HAMP domain-containing protein [Myxococcota bacterium]
MRLWRQLALVMAVLAVVPASVLGGVAVSTVDDEWRQASERRVRVDATERASLLGEWLAGQYKFIQGVPPAFVPAVEAGFTPDHQTGILNLLYRLLPDAKVAVIVDEQGQLTVPAVPRSAPSERVADLVARLPLAAAQAEPQRAHLGPAWVPAGQTRPSVPVAVTIATMGDRFRVLAVELTLPVAPAVGQQEHGLLGQDGQPLFVSGPLIQPAQLALLQGSFNEFATDEPEPAHGALAAVPGSPGWTVVVAEPERALLRLSERITGQILVGALLATLVGVLAALATALTVSRPVERLRVKAQALADGQLGIRMGIERNDEIGELASTFDHLSVRLLEDQARIKAQQTEIAAFNEELQSRVEERTQQLREAQDQLVRTSQIAAVAELGAGLAHDLNNPLTGVLGLAQVLKSRHPDNALIASLESEAQRCRDVVNAMQRATTLEIDPTRSVSTDLNMVVRHASDWVASSYAQRGIGLRKEAPENVVEANIDPEQGMRILSQILQSVRSGLPEESVVTVKVIMVETGNRERPAIRIEADRKVAEQPAHHDDWLTASRVMWVTHQSIARLGGELHRPEEGRVWQWVL